MKRSILAIAVIAVAAIVVVLLLWGPGDRPPLRAFDFPDEPNAGPFATAVSLDGGRALVGMYVRVVDDMPVHFVHLFDVATGALLQSFAEPEPEGELYELDDNVVLLSGNRAVVSQPQYEGTGQVALFDADTGALIHAFDPPTGRTPNFGIAVALEGDLLAIGSPYAGADSEGEVYVYDAVTGALLRTLSHPDPVQFGAFGNALSLRNGRLLVGAPMQLTDQGFGRVYLFDAADGALLKTFEDPDDTRDDNFGWSLDFLADGFVACEFGACFAIDIETGGVLEAFGDPASDEGGFYGISVAAAAGRVLVGESGRAYLFDADGGSLLATFSDPLREKDETDATHNWFARALDLDGAHVLVGLARNDAAPGNAFPFSAAVED